MKKDFFQTIADFCSKILLKLFGYELSDEKKNSLVQFIKFGFVGASNTIISYVIYFVLVKLSVYYLIASVIGFVASVINSFFWNNKYVFKKGKNESRSLVSSFIKTFIAYAWTGLFLSNILLYIWVDIMGINKIIAPVITLLITIPLNFAINKFWAFKTKKHPCSAIVTGCTGSVGVALIEKLVSEGVTVYAVLNPDSDRNSNVPDSEKVKRIFCDISSYSALPSLINEKCDAFFHLAWAGTFGSGRNDVALQQKNIEYSLDAVNAAKELGCSVFIGVGSQAEYGRVNEKLSDKTPTNPENEYGKAKLVAGERTRELCRTLGIRHEWVRLLSVFGPFDNKDSLIYSSVSALKNGVSPQYTKGEQIWNLLWSGDAANAIYLTALKGSDGEIYVVGSGEEKPLKEYIKKIHSVVAPDIPPVFGEREYAENQVTYLCANTNKIKGIGFSSETPFEEAIKRMASEIK